MKRIFQTSYYIILVTGWLTINFEAKMIQNVEKLRIHFTIFRWK